MDLRDKLTRRERLEWLDDDVYTADQLDGDAISESQSRTVL